MLCAKFAANPANLRLRYHPRKIEQPGQAVRQAGKFFYYRLGERFGQVSDNIRILRF